MRENEPDYSVHRALVFLHTEQMFRPHKLRHQSGLRHCMNGGVPGKRFLIRVALNLALATRFQ